MRRAIISHKYVTGGDLLWQGQSGKICPVKSGKCGIFLVSSLCFHRSLPRIWNSYRNKNWFSDIGEFCFVKLKTVVFKGIRKLVNFGSNNSHKPLNSK